MVKDGSAGDALGRLKANRDQHKKPEGFLAANAAASSHLKNDDYMNTFHRAMLRDLEEISTEEASVSAAQHPQPGKGNAVQASKLQEYASVYPPAVVDGWISGPVNESGATLAQHAVTMRCAAGLLLCTHTYCQGKRNLDPCSLCSAVFKVGVIS